MPRYHRPLWNEGLFLTPHHLQQSDLFHEHQLSERMGLGVPHPWGVRSLEVDQVDLASGTVRVLSFRGFLPGGTAVCFPEIDPAPAGIDVRNAFDIRTDHLDVYLGLPVRRSGWPNCRLSEDSTEDRAEVRYSARAVTVEDENSGRDERTIQRSEMNLRLLLGNESRDNFECLPIARVEKNAAGGFQLVDSYVPPLLALEGSPYLTQLNRSLLERLVTRSSGLAGSFSEAGVDTRDITPANLRSFLRFAMINGAIPHLAHYRDMPATRPEQLYLTLAGLVGQLATFAAARVHPRDVPAYRHDDLGPVFTQLQRMIVELLELNESQGYHVIPLTRAGEGRFQARIEKDGLLQPSAALFLAVASEEIGERDLRSRGADHRGQSRPDRAEAHHEPARAAAAAGDHAAAGHSAPAEHLLLPARFPRPHARVAARLGGHRGGPGAGHRDPARPVRRGDRAARTGGNPMTASATADSRTRGRLTRCAGSLLALLIVLRRSHDLDSFSDLRLTVDREFHGFRSQARDEGAPAADVDDASYALAAAFDEALLSASWQGRGAWQADSLARRFCNDEFVGDGFYDKLAAVRRATPPRTEVVEIFYYCLVAGFQGRLVESPREREGLVEELSREVGSAKVVLAPHGVPEPEGGKLQPIRRFPWPVVVLASVFIPVVVWLLAWDSLDRHAERIQRTLGGM